MFNRFFVFLAFALGVILISDDAKADHLFTQGGGGNTQVSFSAGDTLTATQTTVTASAANTGRVEIYFNSDFDSGDGVKITIGAYTETFTFDNIATELTGGTAGASSLTGTSATLTAANITSSNGDTFTIEATSGNFTWTGYRFYTGNSYFNGAGSGTINQALLNAGSGNFEPSSDTSTSGVANTLDNLVNTASGTLKTVVDDLNTLSSAAKSQRMKKLVPETSGSVAAASAAIVSGGIDSIKVRISESLGGIGGSDLTGNTNVKSVGMSSGDHVLRNNFWVKSFFEHGLKDNAASYAGFETDAHGASFGFDYTTPNDVLLGIAYTYSSANVKMRGFRTGDGTDVTSHQLTPYVAASYGDWAFEGMLSMARHSYNSNRDTETTGIAYGDFYGLQFTPRIGTSYDYAILDNWKISPELAVEYDYSYTSEYSEEGAGVLGLSVDADKNTRLRSILGMSTEANFDIGEYGLTPGFGLNWTREYKREGGTTTSSFTGGGDSFASEGQRLDEHKFGAALTMRLTMPNEAGTLSMKVNGDASKSYKGYGGQLQYRFAF